MASILAKLSALLGRPTDEAPMLRDLDAPRSSPASALFRPFVRRGEPGTAGGESLSAITDVLVSMRESIERQGQRHEELMQYLSHLPKAMEMIPENSRLQSEALAAIRQHLENQGSQARQMGTILEKVGQAAVDQRRILDAVRQRLDALGEHDQKVAEHFNNFANALTTSSDTTKLAGQVLESLETNIRQRDEMLERIIRKHQGRHTVLLAMAVVLSAAALLAATVGVYVVQQAR